MHHKDLRVAFRCKTCGHMVHGDHAGENHMPHSCPVCNSGVKLLPEVGKISDELANPKTTPERIRELAAALKVMEKTGGGVKSLHPDNWEVLADATPERLAELELAPHHVTRHVPKKVSEPNLTGVQAVHGTEVAGAGNKPNAVKT